MKKKEEIIKPEQEKSEVKTPKVKKAYTFKLYMMVISGIVGAVGLICFVAYVLTEQMMFGAPGVIMTAAGGIAFRYFWKKEGETATEHISGQPKGKKVSYNSLCIYPDKVIFENVHEPKGFPMQCLNDNKKYFVNIWDVESKRLIPFVLPDQQYSDPGVFAQRVLGLPAHRRIFAKKPKLIQKLKTGLLVGAIAIVWLLILTTTGSGG